MRCAVLSDIHGNLIALEAVLRDIEKKGGVDHYWSLGDIVDYGPQPHLCLERIFQLNALGVVGNHEYALTGQMDLKEFSESVTVVTRWTRQQMTTDDMSFLKNLPLTISSGFFTLAHGSPRDPVREYLLSGQDAAQNLSYFGTPYCLVGHTHVPLCFSFPVQNNGQSDRPTSQAPRPLSQACWEQLISRNQLGESLIQLTENRLIINPGSVGQPRDHDPRAAYAVFDSTHNTLELRRVEYDIAATQRRMAELRLPEWLIQRLSQGE